MRPMLLIMWTAFQSFILRDNNNQSINQSIKERSVEFYPSNDLVYCEYQRISAE